MEKTEILTYNQPTVRIIEMSFDTCFCLSGTHEGFTEEDWDEP